MNHIYELGSNLQRLLSILKKNRESVPRELLQTRYHDAYYQLLSQINQAARTFACTVLAHRLVLNPYISMEEQVAVINRTIRESNLIPQMNHCLGCNYDVQLFHNLVLKLREQVELALWPFVNQETCLVADLDDLEKEPIIYNTLTHQVYEQNTWIDRKIDLTWKLLIYSSERTYDTSATTPTMQERIENNERTYYEPISGI